MTASSQVKIERKSSIESEPRTLSPQQLQGARDAALYIMNTKSLEEAISIFTEGLQPVLGLGHTGWTIGGSDDEAEDADPAAAPARLRQSRLLLRAVEAKDILSAPF